MCGIVKEYPGVTALRGVSFDVRSGEVHCLVGENGAGKSTLTGILAGAVRRTAGDIFVEGRSTDIASPIDALRRGIGMIYQESRLVPELTVAENIALGREPRSAGGVLIDRAAVRRIAEKVLSDLGEDIPVTARARDLDSAQQQIVEIAKAFARDLRVLVLDEPTAALTEREKLRLFALIRGVQAKGTGIIYISHRLEEIFEIGDRVTVLRDGEAVGTRDVADVDRAALIRMMVGRDLDKEYPKEDAERGAPLLELRDLSTRDVHNVSFAVHAGEIFGIAGLIGSGKVELSRALFGEQRSTGGALYIDGTAAEFSSPADAIAKGVALLTEDRNALGLLMNMSVAENITLSSLGAHRRRGFVNRAMEQRTAEAYTALLKIKTPSSDTSVAALSGGNRQKVILARWLNTGAKVLVFNEPTAGVDVGAKFEIYTHIVRLAKEGKAVVLLSSDLPELLGMCDRIGVMCHGRMTGILEREKATQENIMELATPDDTGARHGN
ncbi:MAG: sugar ABC transporter ATP-binding protein [Ignavibacteria bacterium]|nr:sugar ABC transporter ATP-binding protein [Ignavibacteria bacterium]